MKKYFFLITLITFLVTQSTFAVVIKRKSIPDQTLNQIISTSTPDNFEFKKDDSGLTPRNQTSVAFKIISTSTLSGVYKACIDNEVKKLTDEMKIKRKEALNEFRTAYKRATSTETRKELKKNYTEKIKEINKWFNQKARKIKEECKQLTNPTTTTSTSSQQ